MTVVTLYCFAVTTMKINIIIIVSHHRIEHSIDLQVSLVEYATEMLTHGSQHINHEFHYLINSNDALIYD